MRSGERSTGSVEEYLDRVPAEDRAALEQLRGIIRAMVPDADEVISYGVPTFRRGGNLVGYGAATGHLSFFAMSGSVLGDLAEELSPFGTSKGTVRFTREHPIPRSLVERIVGIRMAENEARHGA